MVDDPTIWFNEPLFKRTIHPATSPRPSAGVVGKVWTAIVPDEPYRAKGLCREGNFPLTPCTFALSPSAHLSATTFGPQYWGYLCKNFLARLAPASQARHPLSVARRSCLITRVHSIDPFATLITPHLHITQISSKIVVKLIDK